MEHSGWDGEWYLRGFFDNGAPLGSHANQEARIDSLPQSWAVISQAAAPDRARQAMASAERYLVDGRDRLVKLFAPPFDHSNPNPGYIMGYPPGLRENGGQYTHGSLWMAMARARMGDGKAAVHLLKMMNPVELARDAKDVARYRGEPYVVAADVSSAEGKTGKAGWTWYTGSAGWMYRIWIEEVLGFQLRGDILTLKPVIPDDWPGFQMTYRYRSTTYEIEVFRSDASASLKLEMDGRPLDDRVIHLADDGITHHVTVRLARSIAPVIEGPVRPPANGRPKTGPSNGNLPSNSTVKETWLTSGE
jgi:cyclic beta-1,2-glucan synthetase